MNTKQQVFWISAASIVAAVFGSMATYYIPKWSSREQKQIYYIEQTHLLPSEMCAPYRKYEFSEPLCSVYIMEIFNKGSDPIKDIQFIIQAPDDLTKTKSKEWNFSVDGRYGFVSSDFSFIKSNDREWKFEVKRFPERQSLQISAITNSLPMPSGFKIVTYQEDLIISDLKEIDIRTPIEKYVFAALIGFMLLPMLAAVSTFFTWLKASDDPPADQEKKTDA